MLQGKLIGGSGKSAVINVSSGASYFPFTGSEIYSGAKLAISYLAQGLDYEFKEEGHKVDFLDYRPGYVESKLSKHKASLGIPTAVQAATEVFRDLGRKKKTHGWWYHDILAWNIRFYGKYVPDSLQKMSYKRMTKIEGKIGNQSS